MTVLESRTKGNFDFCLRGTHKGPKLIRVIKFTCQTSSLLLQTDLTTRLFCLYRFNFSGQILSAAFVKQNWVPLLESFLQESRGYVTRSRLVPWIRFCDSVDSGSFYAIPSASNNFTKTDTTDTLDLSKACEAFVFHYQKTCRGFFLTRRLGTAIDFSWRSSPSSIAWHVSISKAFRSVPVKKEIG